MTDNMKVLKYKMHMTCTEYGNRNFIVKERNVFI